MKLFLLDAYALIYRGYYGLIKNPRINSRGEDVSAIFGFFNTLEEVLTKEQPTHIGVAFDPHGGTFRHERYPEYKAQRDVTPEAIRFGVPVIKEILADYHIPVLEVAGYEADDVIGTLAAQAEAAGYETYMMTPDKDYGQLVSEHVAMFKPKNMGGGFEILRPEDICNKWGIERTEQVVDILGLMGDAADNIPGCPGVGEKTAATLVRQFGSIEELLKHTDQLKGKLKERVEGNREQIILSRWLAQIVTDVPIQLDMEALKRCEPDNETLVKKFMELEMRSLANRKRGEEIPAPSQNAKTPTSPTGRERSTREESGQLDLFAAEQTTAATATGTAETNAGNGETLATETSTERGIAAEDAATARELESYERTGADYHICQTKEERAELMKMMMEAKEVALDTETTSTEAIDAELVGLSFAIREKEAYYVPVPAEREAAQAIVEEFRPLYEHPEILKIGQNLKYDFNVLGNYGVRLAEPMFDTMIAHYLLEPDMRHGMDYLAEVYLHYQTIHIDELIGKKERGKVQKSMREVAVEQVGPYAAEDADITLRLKHFFLPKLQEEGALELFEKIEMPLMPVLADMERTGVCIDTEALRQSSQKMTAELGSLEEEIHAMAGEAFNINSPKQVGEVLFERLRLMPNAKKTKAGAYSTNEEVLQRIRGKHPIVDKILEYRGKKKLIGTYLDALPQLINPRTGHIHTSFNQTVAATGRLSSSDPNLQNIPVRSEEGKEIRKAFVPEAGQLFFSADYSQVELRIMAHLSGDKGLVDDFLQGHDIHAATAAKIFHRELPLSEGIKEVTREERSKAKTANFGIIYGITAFGLTERLGIGRSEAKALIDNYFETYPRVHAFMQESIDKARQRGYTETICHRRCYLRDINSANATVRGFAERNAINSPIQGSAADIIKIAMVSIHRRFREEGLRSRMILQVHDELNFSVVPEEKERVEEIVMTEMQGAIEMKVPLIADAGWGKNWLEAH
ncbi:MAG: DNA polymerase I [Bacteroidaceae bacterium]|nr:DNA polymerase I [Bacteroidaceae bacterium]